MAILRALWERSVSSDLESAKDTLSSWDSCMSKAYCKWPVIVAIIVAALVVLSLLFCLARCVCCGAECCCGCLACCNACCPSPSRRKKDRDQREQLPPQPYPPYGQYQSPFPPSYSAGFAYGAPQTATFDAPSGKNGRSAFNEDSLPAMPSWDNAATRRVEQPGQADGDDEGNDDLELEKLESPSASQHAPLTAAAGGASPTYAYQDNSKMYAASNPAAYFNGNRGYQQVSGNQHAADYQVSTIPNAADYRVSSNPHAADYPEASPYGDYNSTYDRSPHSPRPFNDAVSSPVARSPTSPVARSPAPGYGARAPSSVYPASSYTPQPTSAGPGGYAPSIAPSYHTYAPSILTPGAGAGVNRRPVQGSWRDV